MQGWAQKRTSRNDKDVTEAEEFKKSGRNTQQNYTENVLMTSITMIDWSQPRARHSGVWSQVGLGSITMSKASECDGILAELLQILKSTL